MLSSPLPSRLAAPTLLLTRLLLITLCSTLIQAATPNNNNINDTYLSSSLFTVNTASSSMRLYLSTQQLTVAVVSGASGSGTNCNPVAAMYDADGTGSTKWSGFSVDLFDETMTALVASDYKKFNFTWKYYTPASSSSSNNINFNPYGSFNPSTPSNWGSGTVMQDLIDQRAESSAMPLLLSPQSTQAVLFSQPFMQVALVILLKIQTQEEAMPAAFEWVNVFSAEVWATLIGSLFAVAAANLLLNYISPYANKRQTDQTNSVNSYSWSTRFFLLFVLFLSLIVAASYTANLSASLTTRSTRAHHLTLDPIMSVADLSRTRSSWCSRSGSVYSAVLGVDSTLSSTWVKATSISQCLQMLRDGTVAAAIEFSHNADYQLAQAPCNIKTVGKPFAKVKQQNTETERKTSQHSPRVSMNESISLSIAHKFFCSLILSAFIYFSFVFVANGWFCFPLGFRCRFSFE